MTKTLHAIVVLTVCSLVAMCFLTTVPQAQAQNSSPDKYALYGGCWQGVPFNASAYVSKSIPVFDRGKGATWANIAGIVVLDCHHWDGGGGYFITACPAGTPYSYCIQNDNDGAGNHIYLGVLELNSTTDPNAQYGGCAAGSGYRQKSELILEAMQNIRGVNAIVVTECHGFDGPGGTVQVPCPTGSFYTACFKNENDGAGNHVEFGVLKSFNPSDPVSQYGRFTAGSKGPFRPKSAIVTDLGKSLDKVTGITILDGFEDYGGGTRIIDCQAGETFTYCAITSGDPTGDGVRIGVTERP